jgi:hypothetical protein
MSSTKKTFLSSFESNYPTREMESCNTIRWLIYNFLFSTKYLFLEKGAEMNLSGANCGKFMAPNFP